MYLILSPAYGRDYKSKAAILADWQEGKDFVANNLPQYSGRYVSSREVKLLKADGFTNIEFRYNKLQSVCVSKI